MKPIQLYVTAFGPYADAQLFDFRKLGTHGFFLIHGNTGAGKSTVLDAICYALYGDSSGGERKGEQMRSHHAPDTRPTSVLFDFVIGDESYRVSRSPTQDRQKKVGVGTTREQQTAKLWRRSSCDDDKKNGEVLAERWEEVNRTILDILGFTSTQFRQVVVLPQGQFRQFLTANSGTREQILSMLFRTDQYQAITDTLKANAKRLLDQCEDLREQQLGICMSSGVRSVIDLKQLWNDHQIAHEILIPQVKLLNAAVVVAAQCNEQGIEHNRLFQVRLEAEKAVAALETKRGAADIDREMVRRARQAASLADVETMLIQRTLEAQAAQSECARLQLAHTQAINELQRAKVTLATEQSREAERHSAHTELAKLNALRVQIDALEEAENTLANAERESTAATTAYAIARVECERLEQALSRSQSLALPLHEQALQCEKTHLLATQAAKQHSMRERIDILVREQEKFQQACAEAERELTLREQRRDLASADLDQLDQAWLNSQAAILAERLMPGQPCPVCGALDHPDLAVSTLILPDQQQLKVQREALKNYQTEYDRSMRQFNILQRESAAAQAEYDVLVQQLGEASIFSLAELSAQLEEARRHEQEAVSAAEQLPGIEQEITTVRAQLEQAQLPIHQCDQQVRIAELHLQSARAVLMTRQNDIPTALHHRATYEHALVKAVSLSDELANALAQATEKAAQANVAAASIESTLAAQMQTAEQARKLYEMQRQEFVDRIHQATFVDENDYRQAILSSEIINQLETALREYDNKRAMAANVLMQATIATANVEQPDLVALETAHREAQQAYQDVHDQVTRLYEQVAQSERALTQANDLADELAVKEARYTVVGRIASVAAGEVGDGISFQRFMLGSMLDEVLINASERLRWMSRERYILERTDENDDRRRAGGLDLQIFDGETGQPRKAATLSGGESFLAALALALGLADVVQSHAGGIHLDTMFVDEGFGSLDDATLDLAIEALMKLQQSGRMVGIISHVAELRQRIPARLEITAAPGGSSARFVIASAP